MNYGAVGVEFHDVYADLPDEMLCGLQKGRCQPFQWQ